MAAMGRSWPMNSMPSSRSSVVAKSTWDSVQGVESASGGSGRTAATLRSFRWAPLEGGAVRRTRLFYRRPGAAGRAAARPVYAFVAPPGLPETRRDRAAWEAARPAYAFVPPRRTRGHGGSGSSSPTKPGGATSVHDAGSQQVWQERRIAR